MLPPWMFREFAPAGVDPSSPEAVAVHDNALLDRLGVGPGTHLVDLACGTGAFAVEAARRGARVHGVDVAEQMLEHAWRRAAAAGVEVVLHHAGFLTYVHVGAPADVVTIKSALHHLPDFWKQVALLNVAGYLRPGGTLYLWDLLFTFPPAEYARNLQRLVDGRADCAAHLREKFSTFGWILEGMLDRAGFDVISRAFPRPTHGEFVGRRR